MIFGVRPGHNVIAKAIATRVLLALRCTCREVAIFHDSHLPIYALTLLIMESKCKKVKELFFVPLPHVWGN